MFVPLILLKNSLSVSAQYRTVGGEVTCVNNRYVSSFSGSRYLFGVILFDRVHSP